jgi:Glycosyl transferase 4-like domain
MRRVLIVFEPPDGGVAENVRQLALGLSAHGWEPHVAGPREAMCYTALEGAGVPVHRLAFSRGYGRPRADAEAVGAVRSLLWAGRFDLVHSHASKAGVLARLAAPSTRTPSLYSPHCFAFASELPLAWRLASAAVERALGRAYGSILCVCEHERELALRFGVCRPS